MIKKNLLNIQNEIFSKHKFKRNKCLLKFLLFYFLKSKIGPLISFLTPIIFMIMYIVVGASALEPGSSDIIYYPTFANALPAYIMLSIFPISLISIPQMMVELKNSILLRRIKNSGFNEVTFILLISLLFFFVISFFILFILAIFFSILNVKTSEVLSHINPFNLVYSILSLLFCSIPFGIFIGSILKNVSNVSLIGIAIFLLTLIFAGQFVPLQVIGTLESFKIASLFSPLNFSANLINNTVYNPGELFDSNGQVIFQDIPAALDIFNFSTPLKIMGNMSGEVLELFSIWQKFLNLIMPHFVFLIFMFLSIKFFSWYGR